jgi:hypothetical protein
MPRRLVFFTALLALFFCGRALAQSSSPLSPDQVPSGVTAATAQYVANQGYGYGGDCQTTTPDQSGDACSLVYAQADGTWLVTLSAVNPDGSPSLPPYDQLTVTPDQAVAALAAASAAAATIAVSPTTPSSPPGISAPLSVTVTLSTGTCRGGTVSIVVTVLDGAGNPVAGANVTGYVQYRTTAHSFAFPPTNSAGRTSTSVDTGRPRGGYSVVWTVTATIGNLSGTGTTTCYAP